jgi:Phospholipase_D-nuclease N-terminal
MIATLAQVTVDPSGGPTVVVNSDQVPGVFWVFFVFIFVLGIASLALWIWALVDAIRVPDDRYYQSGTKLVWVLVIVLLQVIGAIVYLIAGRPNKDVRQSMHAEGGPSGGTGAMPPPPPPPAGTV